MILSNHAKGLLSVTQAVNPLFVNQLFPTFNEVFGTEDDDEDFDREREVFIKFSTQYAP